MSDLTHSEQSDTPLVRHLKKSAIPEIALLAEEISDEIKTFLVASDTVQQACLAYGPRAFPTRMKVALEGCSS